MLWLFLLTKYRHLSGACDDYRTNRQQKSGEGNSVDSPLTKNMYIPVAVRLIPLLFLEPRLPEWFQ